MNKQIKFTAVGFLVVIAAVLTHRSIESQKTGNPTVIQSGKEEMKHTDEVGTDSQSGGLSANRNMSPTADKPLPLTMGTVVSGEPTVPQSKKENNCFRFSYQHQQKDQQRDLEDYLNDSNAFPIAHENVNPKSICVKVNDKPVEHQWVKKRNRAEVVIGAVAGPDATIQVSYCVGKASCKESCAVKITNKVDELLNENEVAGLENAELETQVRELGKVASMHGDLVASTVVRDWDQLQSKEWVCEK